MESKASKIFTPKCAVISYAAAMILPKEMMQLYQIPDHSFLIWKQKEYIHD